MSSSRTEKIKCCSHLKATHPHTQDMYAILVGINYTKHAQYQLGGCINDVLNWRRVLTERFGYRLEDIMLLSDDPNQDSDHQPTRRNIFAAIDRMTQHMMEAKKTLVSQQKSKPFVFVFSSHGGQIPAQDDSTEADGLDECLFDCDMQVIRDNELRTSLVERVPSGIRLFCAIDACNSATALDLPFLVDCQSNSQPTGKQATNEASIICISGCRDTETSAVKWIDNKEQSVLSALLVALLEGKAKHKWLCYFNWRQFHTVLDMEVIQQGYGPAENRPGEGQLPILTHNRLMDLEDLVDNWFPVKETVVQGTATSNHYRTRL